MERQGRTWLCSVVFLDIVGYTKRPVEQQIEVKEHFKQLVSGAVPQTADREHIFVDTGDGAALCFLGDPEEALFATLDFRKALVAGEVPFQVRMGINLGPIKLVQGMSGQMNPLGDGINNAQRIMSFAQPDQILVSRSFYEVIACLSDEYAQLFRFAGVQKDKHIKEYALYEVSPPIAGAGWRSGLGPAREGVSAETVVPAPHSMFDQAALQRAEETLAVYIGPLASVLVKKAAPKVTSLEALYQFLADSFLDGDARTRFLEDARGLTRFSVTNGPGPAAADDAADADGEDFGYQTPIGLDLLQAAEDNLTFFLGPVARVLVKKAAAQAASFGDLVELLVSNIASDREREAYRERMRQAHDAAGD